MTARDRIRVENYYNMSGNLFPELPRQQGLALFLISIYTTKEAAFIMNLSENTVRNHARLARRKIYLDNLNPALRKTPQFFSVRLNLALTSLL